MSAADINRFYFIIGNELRKARARKGLSQMQLFDATGVARETISRIESGSRRVSLYQFTLICSYLGVSTDEVLRKGKIDENLY